MILQYLREIQRKKHVANEEYAKLNKIRVFQEKTISQLDKELQDSIRSNEQYRNLHKGKRCFVLGSGPSLKTLDFSVLKNEYVFTVNQLPRDADFYKLHSNYHFWSDRLFFELSNEREEDRELLDVMKSVKNADNSPTVFYEATAYRMIKDNHLDKELDIHYFVHGDYPYRNQYLNENLVELTTVLPRFSTVIHYLICVAVYMGFSEIYLLGCDCTGFLVAANNRMNMADKAPYSYDISPNEKKRAERISRERSIRDELASQVAIFDEYGFLHSYCERNGVKLYNATDGGLLDSIPRRSLKEIFGLEEQG